MKAYSGTILENYLMCAIVEGGQVYYVKAKQKKATFYGWLFFTTSFPNAADYAMKIVRSVPGDHVPIIISGEAPHRISHERPQRRYPGDRPFLVEELWVPREGVEFSDGIGTDLFRLSEQAAKNYFEQVSPLEILAQS